MGFLELCQTRYSERKFDPRPIEEEKLARILEAGRLAPTACNYQPQRFLVLKSEESRAVLKSLTPFSYNAPLVILVCYDRNVVWTNPNDRYYKNYNSGEQDASIAAASMMFEAEEQGIQTLWARGFDSASLVQAFGLPDNLIPVMFLALGYPADGAKAHPWHYARVPLEEMAKEV